jgi:hypothetical protein
MRTKLENKNIYEDLRENSEKKQKFPSRQLPKSTLAINVIF